jgi:type IV pilus assembly protein PilW
MNNKGFSLIEIMVAMAIMSMVLALTFPAFTNLLRASKAENASNEAHIDKITSLELIRMDLEHTNYGIASNTATTPISWNSAGKTLQLHSTINNTAHSTIGWMLYDCTSGGTLAKTSSTLIQDQRQDTGNTCFVLLDTNRDFVEINTTDGTCPGGNGIYTAFPLTRNKTGTPCRTIPYTSIEYKLSTGTNTLSDCAKGTKNLLRAVDSGTGDPILNCVADFTTTFELDTDGDGAIDSPSAASPPAAAAAVLAQVKNINMYILMQVGKKDEKLNSSETLNAETGVTLSKAGITDPQKYRWKVVRISGKPMSW